MDMLDEQHADTIEEMLEPDQDGCPTSHMVFSQDGEASFLGVAEFHGQAGSTFPVGDFGGEQEFDDLCEVDLADATVSDVWEGCFPTMGAGAQEHACDHDAVEGESEEAREMDEYDLMGFDKVTRLIERHAIEVAPLAFMRGRTLNHAFIILDEAQNTTPEQMQMFLTRIGFGARAVVTGDPTQIDLPKHVKSGLMDANDVLEGVRGIAFTHFQSEDVVRHPLVGRIVDAYAARRAETDKH